MLTLLIGRLWLFGRGMLGLCYSCEVVDLGIEGGKVLFDNIGQLCDFNRSVVEDGFPFCDCAC